MKRRALPNCQSKRISGAATRRHLYSNCVSHVPLPRMFQPRGCHHTVQLCCQTRVPVTTTTLSPSRMTPSALVRILPLSSRLPHPCSVPVSTIMQRVCPLARAGAMPENLVVLLASCPYLPRTTLALEPQSASQLSFRLVQYEPCSRIANNETSQSIMIPSLSLKRRS